MSKSKDECSFGETKLVESTSPFLGHISSSKSHFAVENNLFRAQIYEHAVPQTDFLIIQTSNQ